MVKNIHNRFENVYGEQALSLATVKRWAAEFKRGCKSIEDASNQYSSDEELIGTVEDYLRHQPKEFYSVEVTLNSLFLKCVYVGTLCLCVYVVY